MNTKDSSTIAGAMAELSRLFEPTEPAREPGLSIVDPDSGEVLETADQLLGAYEYWDSAARPRFASSAPSSRSSPRRTSRSPRCGPSPRR